MKKGLLIICLFTSSIVKAQRKNTTNPDTLNFSLINESMKAIHFNDSITYLRANSFTISKLNSAAYNEKRNKSLEALMNNIDNLNDAVQMITDQAFIDARLNDLASAILNTKKQFPQFNIKGYERVYNFSSQKEVDRKSRKQLADQERLKQQDINYENSKKWEKEKEAKKLKAWQVKDSIDKSEKHKQDSINFLRIRRQDLEFRKECIKLFGSVKGAKIARGEIELGYTKEMCEYAWGMADDITYSTSKNGTIDLWYYRKSTTFLSFKGNKLIRITQ